MGNSAKLQHGRVDSKIDAAGICVLDLPSPSGLTSSHIARSTSRCTTQQRITIRSGKRFIALRRFSIDLHYLNHREIYVSD